MLHQLIKYILVEKSITFSLFDIVILHKQGGKYHRAV